VNWVLFVFCLSEG